MHQGWPILDCSRDRKADNERESELNRQTERETDTMTSSPCVYLFKAIIPTVNYYTSSNKLLLMLQCPSPSSHDLLFFLSMSCYWLQDFGSCTAFHVGSIKGSGGVMNMMY
ncbi:hypothetical protein AMECASPLE_014658 [Ameca splendens]|uniref:Uncharacterized protein n=1 Tax=Ameca splendens TaxID=208324 RepID=A0ABV0ZY52_9TELE